MRSEIENAAATRKRVVTKPGLVRPIAVMKLRIDSKHFPQLTTLNQITDRLHCRYRSIRQIHSQQPVRIPRCIDYHSRLRRIPPERLLTEHRNPALECRNRLLGVKAIRRRNHDSIEILTQQFLKVRELNRIVG